jgi:hypothetical protein
MVIVSRVSLWAVWKRTITQKRPDDGVPQLMIG